MLKLISKPYRGYVQHGRPLSPTVSKTVLVSDRNGGDRRHCTSDLEFQPEADLTWGALSLSERDTRVNQRSPLNGETESSRPERLAFGRDHLGFAHGPGGVVRNGEAPNFLQKVAHERR